MVRVADDAQTVQDPVVYHTRLRDLRIGNHETQLQVALALNVPLSTYGAWERGNRELRAENIKRLADHFNVSPNEILDVGEVATRIPRVDSRYERFLYLFKRLMPAQQDAVVTLMESSAKRHR